MLTDTEIQNLIKCPKKITSSTPAKGMIPDPKSSLISRKNMELVSESGEHEFIVFMRKNTLLTEQFSIGLLYKTRVKNPGRITLLRYNGEHGTSDFSKDGHFGTFHTHRINQALIEAGIYEPSQIEITTSYQSFEQALTLFYQETNIPSDGFPVSSQQEIDLFHGE